jgi:hypothetical protein
MYARCFLDVGSWLVFCFTLITLPIGLTKIPRIYPAPMTRTSQVSLLNLLLWLSSAGRFTCVIG